MDTEKFLKSSFAKELMADAGNMEEDVKEFNLLYHQFLEHDAAAVGVILRSHLIVEHFLVLPLLGASPGENAPEARHQPPDLADGVQHHVLRPVQVQDQPTPQAVR